MGNPDYTAQVIVCRVRCAACETGTSSAEPQITIDFAYDKILLSPVAHPPGCGGDAVIAALEAKGVVIEQDGVGLKKPRR